MVGLILGIHGRRNRGLRLPAGSMLMKENDHRIERFPEDREEG